MTSDANEERAHHVQRIPRPAVARPGAPAPWTGWWTGVGRPRVPMSHVRATVEGHPDLPSIGDEDAGGPNSAVLALLWEEEGEARVLLTRRTAWLRSHSGQVAFPGGRVEPGETLVDAALREAEEEVGLDPASVDVIGRLSRMHTISSGSGIFPFVGVTRHRPTLVANPDEVDRVFDVALGELMAESVFHEEIWGIPSDSGIGTERSISFFDVAGETVWGATARMLVELLVLVTARPLRAAGDARLPSEEADEHRGDSQRR